MSELPKEKALDTTNANAVFLATSNSLIFPIFNVKLTPTDLGDEIVEVKVSHKIYDLIKSIQLTDEFPVVLPSSGSLVFWTFDLTLATQILSDLKIMSDKKTWIFNSQKKIVEVLDKKKTDINRTNATGLKICTEILQKLDLLQGVQNTALISLTVMDLKERGEMDPDTIIYRVALAIYHSKNMTGKPLIGGIENEADLYLKFVQSGIGDLYSEQFKPLMDLPIDARAKTLKILLSLIISAYAYYNSFKT